MRIENLFLLPYRSVSEGSGSITTYVQLASGVGTLTEDLLVYVSTSSGSAIGISIICLLEYLIETLFYRRSQATLTITRHSYFSPFLMDPQEELGFHFLFH